MKKDDLNRAMNFLDPALIDEAAPGKVRKNPRRSWVRVLAIAAVFAILVSAVPISLLISNHGSIQFGPGTVKNPSDETEPIVEVNDYVGVPNALFSRLTDGVFFSNRQEGEISAQMQSALLDLSLSLLKKSREENASDTLISPLSVQTALAMAANGAQGKTLKEMLNLLAPGMTQEEFNQQIYNLYAGLSSTEKAKFRASNAIWTTNDGFSVSQGFLDEIDNTFDADVYAADFTDGEKIAKEINDWCAENTDGMIPEILKPDEVSDQTVMMLLNALCFEAKWRTEFTKVTLPATFHSRFGSREVTMMTGDAEYYLQGENVTGFIKQYDGNYAFLALLPDEGVSLDAYLASLTGEKLHELVEGRSWKDVNVTMPIFELDSSFELKAALSELGMSEAFDPVKADFTRLGTVEGDGNVWISRVIHKTHIEVNEAGTRAAAATMVDVPYGCAMPVDVKYVRLDRPFLYAVLDLNNGTPLFIGTCENPQMP